jgi:transcriptional regulator with XRE-family HTH domain
MDHPLKLARIQRNLTQHQLAAEIKVSARTISTAENGERIGLDARRRLCKYFKMSAKDLGLCEPSDKASGSTPNFVFVAFSKQGDTVVVQFDESKRQVLREMLGLIGAGTVVIDSKIPPVKTNTPITLDLEVVEDYVDSLSKLVASGGARHVGQQSRKLYNALAQQCSNDPYVATTQFKIGMLLATAQEYTLPWYQRNQSVMQTYDTLERDVLPKCSLDARFLHQKLVAKRSRYHRLLWQFDEGAKECEMALLQMKPDEDFSLYTHFVCERAHIEATRGDRILWLHKLEDARRSVSGLEGVSYTKALNQINYIQGEGYKRFAYHTRNDYTIAEREKFARLALIHCDKWDGATIEDPIFEAMVVQTSRAQCMILIDPHEALRLAEHIRSQITQRYPTLLDKVHRVEFLAHRRLTTPNDDFLQIFRDTSNSAYQRGGNIL